MQTSKVYIHKNPEGMWEVGVVLNFLQRDGEPEQIYLNKHEASSWADAGNWVRDHYVA